MPTRYTAIITHSVVVRFDAPDGMTAFEAQDLVRKEAEDLLRSGGSPDVELSLVPVSFRMVRDAPRSTLRVSDDRKRLTDEETEWAEWAQE